MAGSAQSVGLASSGVLSPSDGSAQSGVLPPSGDGSAKSDVLPSSGGVSAKKVNSFEMTAGTKKTKYKLVKNNKYKW